MNKASGICYYNINVIINKWIQCEFLMGKKLQLSKLCINYSNYGIDLQNLKTFPETKYHSVITEYHYYYYIIFI